MTKSSAGKLKPGSFKPKTIPCPTGKNGKCAEKAQNPFQTRPCRMFMCPKCKELRAACYGGGPSVGCGPCWAEEEALVRNKNKKQKKERREHFQ